MTVKKDSSVKVHYKGTLEDGVVFDSSEGREPLAFTMGQGMLIPGFENGIIGMAVDETKVVNIPSKEAYGESVDDLIQKIDRKVLPADIQPEVGMELMSNGPQGQQLVVTVVDVQEDSITIDANHKLAGKDLTFEITVVEIS